MDMQTLGAAIAICKGLPDTAAGRAETAAETAEAAAALAVQHGYGLTVQGHTLIVTEAGGD